VSVVSQQGGGLLRPASHSEEFTAALCYAPGRSGHGLGPFVATVRPRQYHDPEALRARRPDAGNGASPTASTRCPPLCRESLADQCTLADPDDDAVLACAVAARAEIIVSGDSHLLDLNDNANATGHRPDHDLHDSRNGSLTSSQNNPPCFHPVIDNVDSRSLCF